MNLKFYRKLYLSEEIENEDSIIETLKEGMSILGLNLICVSKNPNNMLEILKVSDILKNTNKHKEYVIVGMAYGKQNAILVIKNIFESYVLSKKDFKNMKRNFLDNK